MSLPLDVARCTGTTWPTCANCMRREFWPMPDDRSLWMVSPPIDMLTGECHAQLIPQVRYTNSTQDHT